MHGNLVITIGRECGSGGRFIGQKLAERLGIRCYDKELLTLSAQNSGLCEEIFEHHDEKPTNSFLYSLVMDTYSMSYNPSTFVDMPLNQKVFLAQFDTIKQLAEKESCVIVGRCADYALADYPNTVSVFTTATYDDKVEYLKDHYHIEPSKIKDFITKTDKKRASYYNYYSNKKWGSAKSYDLCINRSAVGFDGAVDVILNFIEVKKANQKQK